MKDRPHIYFLQIESRDGGTDFDAGYFDRKAAYEDAANRAMAAIEEEASDPGDKEAQKTFKQMTAAMALGHHEDALDLFNDYQSLGCDEPIFVQTVQLQDDVPVPEGVRSPIAILRELVTWEQDPDRYGGDLADLAQQAKATLEAMSSQ